MFAQIQTIDDRGTPRHTPLKTVGSLTTATNNPLVKSNTVRKNALVIQHLNSEGKLDTGRTIIGAGGRPNAAKIASPTFGKANFAKGPKHDRLNDSFTMLKNQQLNNKSKKLPDAQKK